MKEAVIDVANLTRIFGRNKVIDNISFDVRKGEIVGFLGPNGAGKSTTMRILATYLPASGGTVRVAGYDVFRDSIEVRHRIGYLPENVPLYHDMRVIEYLRFRGKLKGLSGRKLNMRLDETIGSCGLRDARRAIIGTLSKGYTQRVGLADALLHEPELLILDEPTIGLDPNQIRQVRNLIKGLAGRHTVLLSTHILPEVEMVCQRVLIINKGRIVASDTSDNLVGLVKSSSQVVAEFKGPAESIVEKIRMVKGVDHAGASAVGEWVRVVCSVAKGMDIRADLFAVAAQNNWPLRELHEERTNLEDVFVSLTREEIS